MSSAYAKGKLKASREAIAAKAWPAALDAAQEVLSSEAGNYNALVFRALALLNLERLDEAEAAYRAAIAAQPQTLLAWQGLEKFYAQTKQHEKLAQVLLDEIGLLNEVQDATKLAEALQRLVTLQTAEGSSLQLATALELYLPPSPFYSVLSSLPEPDQSAPTSTTTFEAQLAVHVRSLDILLEVMGIHEAVEEATVSREVEKRRTRLDTARKTREELRRMVEAEVLSDSKLPPLYEQVLSHASASDAQRREAESKLLRHRHRLLLATPSTSPRSAGGTAAAPAASEEADAEALARKQHARDELVELAKGMVTIGVQEELAWEVVLDWTDYVALTDLPRERLRAFIYRFPQSGRSLAFRALLHLLQDEQFLLEEAEETKRRDVEQAAPDLLALAIRGLEEAPNSLLAHRIAATFYLLDRDYLSVTDVASSALSLLRRVEADAAVSLASSKRDLETQLAGALTRLHPPQHHMRALRMLSGVLGAAPDSIDALISKGLIDEAAGRWEEARAAFVHVQQLALALPAASPLSPSRAPALEAQGEIAWCDVSAGRLEEGRVALEEVIDRLDDPSAADVVDSTERARAWWRLGRCLWQIGGSSRTDPDQAFTCFITALKRSAGFAPAFTSLGFFYDEVSADTGRASKCFQKAFELDAREDEAARRLAEGFADEREWDLVDVVARRTVEGEGGAEALGAAGSVSQKRHMSRNAWAWRAIGSVELHREKHEEAIAAFQVALRAEPEDAGTWQRLGEAYAASDRQSAALKTFAKALELSHGSWPVRYSIAEVHRELGELDEAQILLEQILVEEPEEIGVRVAAAETSLQLAQRELATGYVLRAEASLETTLQHALRAVQLEPHLRSAWKVAADAIFELSRFGRLVKGRETRDGVVEQLVQLAAKDDVDEELGSVSTVTVKYVAATRQGEQAFLSAAAFLYKACVVLHGSEEDATAWADLAVALHQLELDANVDGATRQGTDCIKRALKLEPGNEALWMILGTLSFKTNVKLAQHCFVRAIEASPRDAVPWSHLGFLYLQHDDAELANEAFIRAQTLDPDLATAWVGQAFVAQHHNDEQAARVLFEHAVGLSEGSALEADYGFAACVFAQFSSASPPASIHLHSPASALSSFVAFRPSDTSALHLSALFCERLGEQTLAIERIERASAILEREYEEDEDVVTATKYAIAQSNLGRIRLDAGDAAGAIEALETALGLLDLGEGDAASEAMLSAGARARVRTAAHLGVALAHFADGAAGASLEAFRAALTDVEGSSEDASGELRAQVGVQMARVLWSLGGDEQQEEAKTQLLDCIAAAPQHIPAITALAALGVLTHDTGLVDAALSEVRELAPDQLQRLDTERDVDFLLSMVQFGDDDIAGALATLEAATKTHPPSIQAHLSLVEARLRVAASSSRAEDVQAALAAAQQAFGTVNSSDAGEAHYERAMRLLALATALSGAAKPQKAPETEQDSDAANGDGMLPPTMPPDMAQRALHAAPWEASNWLAAALERT